MTWLAEHALLIYALGLFFLALGLSLWDVWRTERGD